MAKCHAANLVKYGYSSEYAFHRARKNPEWVPMIEEGIRLGLEKRERREARLREEKEKLAVLGGRPVRSALLSNEGLAPTDEILIELAAAVRRGWIGPGPRVEELERQLAARVGAPHAVALGSASAGIVLSLIASGVRAGDEVIIASLGDPSSIHAIERAGATPVLVDVHPDSLTLDPDAVRAAVTARSRAIVATHFGGLPCDLAALSQIAELHDLALIEDASDALGAECAGHWIGGHGRLTVFSFSGARAVLTGAGGMLTTHDPETAARLRRLSRDGAQCAPQNGPLAPPARPQSIDELGFDCGMTDLAAAVALPQVRHLERHLARRREIADLYDEALAGFPLRLQTRAAAKGSRHAVQRYIVLLEADAWKASRDRVVEALRAENIGARAAGLAMHEQPHHRRRFPTDGAGLPQVESASRCLFDLPVTGQMSDADVESVVRAFRKVAKAYCL